MSDPVLSIVLPAFNESRRIERCIDDLRSFMKIIPLPWEVILVVEKSTDDTVSKARARIGDDQRFILIENIVKKGKGFAVKTGMLKSRGEIVFFMDVDMSTPLVELFHFLGEFEAAPEAQILIGDRKHRGSQIIKAQTDTRKKMGEIFNVLVQKFAIKGIRDTQCGFKAFRKASVRPIFERLKTNGFAFDVEVLVLASKLGFKVSTLPVKWINSKESKVHIFRDSWLMFCDLLLIRLRVWRSLKSLPASSQKER